MTKTTFISPRQAVNLCKFGDCAKAVHLVYNDPILREAYRLYWLHSGTTRRMRDFLFLCFYYAGELGIRN